MVHNYLHNGSSDVNRACLSGHQNERICQCVVVKAGTGPAVPFFAYRTRRSEVDSGVSWSLSNRTHTYTRARERYRSSVAAATAVAAAAVAEIVRGDKDATPEEETSYTVNNNVLPRSVSR